MRILVLGDSWATLSAPHVAGAFDAEVVPDTRGGSTARYWAQLAADGGWLADDFDLLYLSIGALDLPILGRTSGQIARDIATIVRHATDAGMPVLHAGYNAPWFPEWVPEVSQLCRTDPYHYVDLTHFDRSVRLVDWGHLRAVDYRKRCEYSEWHWRSYGPTS